MLMLSVTAGRAGAQQTIPTADPTPVCSVGQPCTFGAPIFVCDYANAEKIAAAGSAKGHELGMSLVREKSCQAVSAAGPLGTKATDSTRVVYLTQGGQHLGYMPVGVFATLETAESPEPEEPVPTSVTPRLQDFTLYRRGPAPVAVQLSGQGTGKAVGLFRAGPAERRDYCTTIVRDGGRKEFQSCLTAYPDEDFPVRADCENRLVTLLDRTYRLHPRPATVPSNTNAGRKWLWRNVATDDWLESTTPPREPSVDSAFDALCPGRRPDANLGVIWRDPAARFPPLLQGVWADNPRTCGQVRHAPRSRPPEGALILMAQEAQGDEYHEELNQLRQLDAQKWAADVSWEGEGDSGQTSVSYELRGDTLRVGGGIGTLRLLRCP